MAEQPCSSSSCHRQNRMRISAPPSTFLLAVKTARSVAAQGTLRQSRGLKTKKHNSNAARSKRSTRSSARKHPQDQSTRGKNKSGPTAGEGQLTETSVRPGGEWHHSRERTADLDRVERHSLATFAAATGLIGVAWWYTDGFAGLARKDIDESFLPIQDSNKPDANDKMF